MIIQCVYIYIYACVYLTRNEDKRVGILTKKKKLKSKWEILVNYVQYNQLFNIIFIVIKEYLKLNIKKNFCMLYNK